MPTDAPWPAPALQPGHLTVVQSAGGRVGPLPPGVRTLRVDAGALRGGLALLRHTEERLRDELTHDVFAHAPWPGIRAGLRRRLLGEEPVAPRGPRVVAGLEQLAVAEGRPVVWVIERAHLADPDTRGWLGRQVRHVGQWSVAVVVGVAPDDPWGAGLAAHAEHCFGARAVVRQSTSARVVHEHPPDQHRSVVADEERPTVGPAAMALLRAAASMGRSFSIAELAALVDVSEHRAAFLIQEAQEGGWELEDAGDGVLRFGRGAAELLRQGVSRAVGEAWARRLRELRGGAGHADDTRLAGPDHDDTSDEPRGDDTTSEESTDHHGAELGAGEPEEPARESDLTDGILDNADHDEDAEPVPAGAVVDDTGSTGTTGAPPSSAETLLLQRAAEARAHGAWNEAAALLATLEQRLPAEELRSGAVGRALRLERTHLAWEATGTGIDLDTALGWAEGLAQDAEAAGDPETAREARVLAAGIAHDIGDPASLDRALDHLQHATRALQAAGRPREAAALLNDQAAVWVRIGDPVRAAHLLEASRQVFAASQGLDDQTELAETLLLLSRLVLHVDARPGKERAAHEQALDHARQAHTLFQAAGDPRHAALAQATEGRLLQLLGRTDEALQTLAGALEAQRALHDVLGLARTADALARVMLAQGRPDRAAQFLADSLRFNAAAGARRGLAYNRELAGQIRGEVEEGSELAGVLEGWVDQLG